MHKMAMHKVFDFSTATLITKFSLYINDIQLVKLVVASRKLAHRTSELRVQSHFHGSRTKFTGAGNCNFLLQFSLYVDNECSENDLSYLLDAEFLGTQL